MCKCTGNNKIYIGQSKDVKLRKCQHLSELRNNHHFNTYLQHSYNKYGEDSLEWRVLEYCDIQILDDREKYWIEQYDTFHNGFNANDGGAKNRGYLRSPEMKKALSDTIKKNWDEHPERKKIFSERMSGSKNPMYGRTGKLNPAYGIDRSGKKGTTYGRHHTEEAKELNRIAHLGANNSNSKPVVCIETRAIFNSMGEAGREMHCDSSTISRCCNGIKKTCGGYHWRYATPEEVESLKQNNI